MKIYGVGNNVPWVEIERQAWGSENKNPLVKTAPSQGAMAGRALTHYTSAPPYSIYPPKEGVFVFRQRLQQGRRETDTPPLSFCFV